MVTSNNKIKILFVEDEEGIREQAKIFLEKEIDEFEVDTVSNSKNAIKYLKDNGYDLIVADYLLPDKNGLQLLKALRNKGNDIPFIILTGKGKEEVAIEALNSGANKYFKKTESPEDQYNRLSKAILELVGKKKETERTSLWDYPEEVILLLKKLLSKEIDVLEPTIDIGEDVEIKYPKVEDLLNIGEGESEDILESLVEEDILEREFYDKFLTCPKCDSTKLKFSTLCPNCGSPNIVKEKILEHMKCGYWAPEEEFENDEGEYICPKCRKKLKAIGVDYAKRSDIFVCRECGEKFDVPDECWHCHSCSEKFSTEEGDERIIYRYRLDEDRKGWLRLQIRSMDIGMP